MRDKLIELQKANCKPEKPCVANCFECMADHLIAHGVTVQQWIPVSERLPDRALCKTFEDEVSRYPMFLVMISGAHYPTALFYNWQNNEWFEINYDYTTFVYSVTHWMPLPEPPKEGE